MWELVIVVRIFSRDGGRFMINGWVLHRVQFHTALFGVGLVGIRAVCHEIWLSCGVLGPGDGGGCVLSFSKKKSRNYVDVIMLLI